jgi:hypothetical protein
VPLRRYRRFLSARRDGRSVTPGVVTTSIVPSKNVNKRKTPQRNSGSPRRVWRSRLVATRERWSTNTLHSHSAGRAQLGNATERADLDEGIAKASPVRQARHVDMQRAGGRLRDLARSSVWRGVSAPLCRRRVGDEQEGIGVRSAGETTAMTVGDENAPTSRDAGAWGCLIDDATTVSP